jgi:hypothetical protein
MQYRDTNRHVQAALRPLIKQIEIQSQMLRDAQEQILSQRGRDFEAAGGCDACNGRGWVVTWDTMDSMSGCYAEYGTCPNPLCTEATRKATGLCRSFVTKYDKNRGIRQFDNTPAEDAIIKPLQNQLGQLQAALADWESKLDPAVKGHTVEVVGGNKVPTGVKGKVIWVGRDGYTGDHRIGIQADDRKEPWWTAAKNCIAVVSTGLGFDDTAEDSYFRTE